MAGTEPFGPGLGGTQRALLGGLKRRGPATLADLRAEVPLTPATLREHLAALADQGLVRRHGTRRGGSGRRGRPEVVWALAATAEELFPQREGKVLREMVAWLDAHGAAPLLARYFAARVDARRGPAKARVRTLSGFRRVAEVARMLSEEGYLTEAVRRPGGQVALRIYHCPVKDLVAATDLPCRTELGLVRELLGGKMVRIEHAAHRQGTCTFATG